MAAEVEEQHVVAIEEQELRVRRRVERAVDAVLILAVDEDDGAVAEARCREPPALEREPVGRREAHVLVRRRDERRRLLDGMPLHERQRVGVAVRDTDVDDEEERENDGSHPHEATAQERHCRRALAGDPARIRAVSANRKYPSGAQS
ncbi:MAG: hypothetical protein KGJ98_07510 [Chloroflexota bacterium]|nr:hypothetical protein [Chloroflexota bacterium]